MRRYALWCSALLATCSNANPHNRRSFNSSSIPPSLLTTDALTPGTSSSDTSSTPSPAVISRLGSTDSPSTTTSLSTSSLSSESSDASSTFFSTSTIIASQNTTTSAISSSGSLHTSNITSLISTNASTTGICTGCVLEAYRPSSTWFWEEWSSAWDSVVVTETILTKTITYMTGNPPAVETIVTEYETLNQTKTLVGGANMTITHTTPVFTITPTYGVELTLPAGPTYVIYASLYGGLDYNPVETDASIYPSMTDNFETEAPQPTCAARVRSLWALLPTRPEDWSYFIQTVTGSVPTVPENTPVPLPPELVQFLKQDPDVQNAFSGSDIATCTLSPTSEPLRTTTAVLATSFASPPGFSLPEPTSIKSTYLSTSYESTSTHVTVRGCLRCDTPGIVPPTEPPVPGPTQKPNNPAESQKPNEQPKPPVNTPDIPGMIASILSPVKTQDPQQHPNNPEQRITVGDKVFDIHPAQPTQPNQPNQENNQENNQVPGVVIGTATLTPGQTTTMNGVQVIVPTAGGGSTIIVDGSTIGVNPVHTGPPVLTVGETTVTANPQGHFVVGTQTLTPGGPAITVDGSTLSLAPSGTIAVVNGVTQTLGNAPLITGAPALTVDGQIISATVIGGSTVFVLGPDQTLTPGGVLTVDGTTYSMPEDGSGSTVVVNGITSTLNAPGLPVLTLNSDSITATVEGGTTAFIFGPGQTLTPGGVITVSGTTYSMPASASGSVVVINGVTSTLGQGPITAPAALTINGKTYSATVRDGTTEYVLGPGTTLKPGEAITVSGTTYSLDPNGTALIINGKTSTIPSTPASNSATTTGTASKSESTSDSTSSSSTTHRNPGNFIASGIGISSKGGAMPARDRGLDKWAESAVIGLAGWVLMLV